MALKPDAVLLKRTLAEALLRLGRPEEALAQTDDGDRTRDDARLRRTRVYAARMLLKRALFDGDAERFHALADIDDEDLSAGAHGAPFRLLTGAVAGDRAEVQSGLAQLVARVRAVVRRRVEEALYDQADKAHAKPGDAETRAQEAAAVAGVYREVAGVARALFEIDGAAGCFLLDVAIASAPDEPALRAERLRCGVARGETDNPNHMLDYALDPRAYGSDVAELYALYRTTLHAPGPAAAATTRALRALRRRQLEVLAAVDASAREIAAAGHAALAFGDLDLARDALAAARSRAEADGGSTEDADIVAADNGLLGHGVWEGLRDAADRALDHADRLNEAYSAASLAAGELAPDFSAAATVFWRDVLDAREPLDAFFESLSDESVNVLAPSELLIAVPGAAQPHDGPEGARLATTRQTTFAAARVLARSGVAHEIRLFPWSVRELDRLDRGKPVFAPYARRGPRANMLIAHGPGPMPLTAYIDRFGVEGWSEIAQTLPFVEARSSETYAHFEAARMMLFGADAPPRSTTPQEAVAVLLQSPMDPRLGLARLTLQDMLNEAAAWAERRRRRLILWRPRGCKHLGVDEAIARLTKSERVVCETAPEGVGALGRAAAKTAGVVTINAPAAFEALLALKPVILGGVADFHHGARMLESAQELPDALDRIDAPVDPGAVARFVYDYLNGPLVNLTSPADVEKKMTAALTTVGLLNKA